MGIDEYGAIDNLRTESCDLFGKGRRRCSGLRPVLIAVPGTGHAAIDDSAFSERSILVLANVGDGRDLAIVAKDRHALAGQRKNCGALFGNPIDLAGLNKTVGPSIGSCPVDPSLVKTRCDME